MNMTSDEKKTNLWLMRRRYAELKGKGTFEADF